MLFLNHSDLANHSKPRARIRVRVQTALDRFGRDCQRAQARFVLVQIALDAGSAVAQFGRIGGVAGDAFFEVRQFGAVIFDEFLILPALRGRIASGRGAAAAWAIDCSACTRSSVSE